MSSDRAMSTLSTRMIRQALGKHLEAGEAGALLARAGVGKTACLTHIAMDYLADGRKVVHVCIDEVPGKVKIWYEELLRNIQDQGVDEGLLGKIREGMLKSRFIMSYLHHSFKLPKLAESLMNLEREMDFRPDLVVVDGLDVERVGMDPLNRLKSMVADHGAALWISCRTHRHIDLVSERGIPYPCHGCEQVFEVIVVLKPGTEEIAVEVLKDHGVYRPDRPHVLLNPRNFLVCG